MKTLSREGIQRMVDGAGGGSVSGGGISSSDLAGLATQVWVNQNYLSIDFFSSLFKAYGPAETEGDPDVEIVPNDTESTISNIKAMFGFWTEQYISALGQGSGGGGGGASALTDLVDVAISNPTDGQVLKYNGTTHKWYNGNDEGLTSLPWSSITGKPTTLGGYGITDAYTKTEADGRYLKLSGGTMSNTNVVTNMNADLLDGLNGADYLSRHNVDNAYDTTPGQKIITVSTGSTIVSEVRYGSLIQWGNSNKTPGTADNSTWYNQLIGMTNNCLYFRTRTNGGDWTTAKKIAFISDFSSWALASTKPSYAFSEITGTIAANQLPDLSGTYAAAGRVTALEGYFTDGVANNAARLSTVSKTAWGQTYWTANGVPDSVSGSIEAGNSGGSIKGFESIELNNHGTLSDYGGFIDFHFNGSSSDYTSRIIETSNGTLSVNSVAMWSGYVKATRFFLSSSVYFQLDANGDVQLVGAGLWTNSFISALGQGSGGGGGGATALIDLVDVAISNPTNGQVLKYNSTTGKWYNGNDEGLTSLPWSSITDKPTTLSGYGITDAYTKTEADGRYLKLSGGTMSNTNVVTNMNADLLDGQHLNYIIREDQSFDFSSKSPISGYIIHAGINSINPPSNICGGNQYTVIQVLPYHSTYGSQLAIGFGTSYLAWRNRQGTTTWGDWQKIKAGYADSAGSAPASDVYAWAKAATKPSYAFSELTSHPTTLGGYGITDAYISSGTIYLGGNSITPLTSFTETDPTVPAWAKAATKPSYSFSELTGSVAFSQLPTMYWADVAVSSSSNNNTSPQFGNLRLRPGSSNYGSYLRFGDGDFAYIAELSDDQLTYRAGSHTFNVSSNEAVQINSSGLRIGGSSGVVLSWDSTNNALKVQKADGTAANLYATGGVSALGMSGGSGGSIGNLRVTGTLNIGSSYTSLYCDSNNRLYVDAPRIYFNSTLYMGSNNIRTESGNIYTEEGNIYLDGGYIYLDSSHYIYLDGTTLKFYDGSTAKTIYTY